MIRKNPNGTFCADISNGRNKRHRRSFKTRIEAQRYERHFLNGLEDGKEWSSKAKDTRKLSDLLNLWYKLHGQTLRNGKRRFMLLMHTVEVLGDPIAQDFNAQDFGHYRANRLKIVKPKTINNEQTYLSSIYNELKHLGEISYPNPLAEVRAVKIPERELSYLDDESIDKLLEELKPYPHTYQAALICLSCGTRWGEVSGLEKDHYKNDQISLFNTKNGKNRYIPLKGEFDLPLIKASTKTFARCYELAGIKKTQGQSTHILRHTFASHFIANGGNILTLQKILGHSDLKMTMRYAHLAPNHLKDVLKFNPVVKMLSKLKSTSL
ncbi:MAG: tyrosine-type recombinase/integrase [Candidatus Ruthia sp.]|jgi:integrase|nr:tyrosine-type recombinase/integrase [Candidatus Ruthturnera sp.]